MKFTQERPQDPSAHLPYSPQDPHYQGKRVGQDPESHQKFPGMDPFGKPNTFAQDPNVHIPEVGNDPLVARERGVVRPSQKTGKPSFLRHRNP